LSPWLHPKAKPFGELPVQEKVETYLVSMSPKTELNWDALAALLVSNGPKNIGM
jgi:hypothetical protein